jgi:hypothetical protein
LILLYFLDGKLPMVSTTQEASLGAAVMGLWAGVDLLIYIDSTIIWRGLHQKYRRVCAFVGGIAVYTQHTFQYYLHFYPVWIKK